MGTMGGCSREDNENKIKGEKMKGSHINKNIEKVFGKKKAKKTTKAKKEGSK